MLDRLSILNSFFQEVYIINLKRRKDRLTKCLQIFNKYNIRARVIEATDGYSKENKLQYEEYVLNDKNQLHTHILEKQYGRKMIGSPGAWGYLLTWRKIIELNIENEVSSFICFDDDVVFHQNFEERLKKFLSYVDYNWKIIHLGASQHSWRQGRSYYMQDSQHSLEFSNFYHPMFTDGSFAVGINQSVYKDLLRSINLMNCAFDSGPLRDIYQKYPNQCFVCYPNIVIADVSESDIGSNREMQNHAQMMHWDIDQMDYPFELEKVSVVMPIYNAETTIQASITSILKQSYANIEIIAVNDSSNDGTKDILKEVAQKDDNIKVVNLKSNLGCYAARNIGLAESSGEIIAIQDADDYSLSNRITNQTLPIFQGLCSFTLSEIYRSRCTMNEIVKSGSDNEILKVVLSKRKKDKNGKYGYHDSPILGFMTSVFHKRLFDYHGHFYESRFAGDMEFFERIYFRNLKKRFTNENNIHSYLWNNGKTEGLYYLVEGINLVSPNMNTNNITNSYSISELNELKEKWRSFNHVNKTETKADWHRLNFPLLTFQNAEMKSSDEIRTNSKIMDSPSDLTELATLRRSNYNLKKSLSKLEMENNRLNVKNLELINSKSWKYTEWLRKLFK